MVEDRLKVINIIKDRCVGIGHNTAVRMAIDIIEALEPPKAVERSKKPSECECDHDYPSVAGWSPHQPHYCSNCKQDL